MSRCRSCKAEIVWAVTVKGKKIPFDRGPVADSPWTLARRSDHISALKASPIHHPVPKWKRYTPHWSTCPDADKHRRRK